MQAIQLTGPSIEQLNRVDIDRPTAGPGQVLIRQHAVSVIGFVGGADLQIPVLPIMLKTLSIIGNNTGSTADLGAAAHAIGVTEIRPVIDRVFPLAQVREAYRYLAGAAHVGKVVVDLEAA